MKTWFEWSIRRHINVAWRWALVATAVLVAPTQVSMQLKGAPIPVSWIPWELPQTVYMNIVALYLIVFLSYLVIAVVSKQVQVEEKTREESRDCLMWGLAVGTIVSFIAVFCMTAEPKNLPWLITILAFLGLPCSIGLGFALGSVTPEKKLKGEATQWLHFFLGCGLSSILVLGITFGPVPLLVIGLDLLLIAAVSFVLTEIVRFLNRKSLWSSIGSWLIAAE